MAGIVSDVTRWEAFFGDRGSVRVALNARHATPAGVCYRFRLSPIFSIPTVRRGRLPELFAVYSGQLSYERSAFRLGVALSARTILTHDSGSLADRSESQAEFHADLGSGRVRPGLELKIPLGDLGNTVPIVPGVSFGVSF